MDIREFLFNNRGYTPIPLVIAVLVLADPSWTTYLCGLGIASIGEGLRIWGVSHAGGATRTTHGVGGEVLITSGPYAHLRNPLYLGNFILCFGLCIMAWAWMPWMLILYIALFALQYSLIISLEEEYLRAKFGTLYEDYEKNVPRFFPRFRPYSRSPSGQGDFKKALFCEKSTLLCILLFCLAVLIRWHLL